MDLIQSYKKNLEEEKREIAFCLLKEKVESGKILTLEVTSSYSMSPFLSQGDTLSLISIKFQGLRRGDIIVYRTNEHLCVHRLIHKLKKDNNCFALIAKGDNVYHFDQLPISKEQLVGKVISIRKNKRVIDLERTSWKIINYLLACISEAQAYVPLSLRFLRKVFLQNRKFRLGIFIKKVLSFIFLIPLKTIVYIAKIVPLFYKKRQS